MRPAGGKVSLIYKHAVDSCASLRPICHPSPRAVLHGLHFPESLADWIQVGSTNERPWERSEGGKVRSVSPFLSALSSFRRRN